jgi:hypothetical protein
MREWSSGASTDFTNYAATRLAERGQLRVEDPIALQRSVMQVAYAYAKGGDVSGRFVPNDSPLGPSQALGQSLGWPSDSLRDEFTSVRSTSGSGAVHAQDASNDAAVRERLVNRMVTPGSGVQDDVGGAVQQRTGNAARSVSSRRADVSTEQGRQSQSYNSEVNGNEISRHHGGNKAVWDTVGAQSDNRARLGTPPEMPPMPRWETDKVGVPRAVTESLMHGGNSDGSEHSTKPTTNR